MSKTPEVIVVHESILASYLKDFATFGSLCAVVGIGVVLDSPALQWVAGLCWVIVVLGAAMKSINSQRFTVAGARKRLDEIEASLAR